MKSLITALVVSALLLSGCSVYRSGQTPDDVYYSPAKTSSGYVQTNNQDDDRYNAYEPSSSYDNYDDRWLRMRVRNRSRWSAFDDYNYYNGFSYAPMGFGIGIGSGFGMGGFGMGGFGSGGFGYNNFGYNNFGYMNPYNSYHNYYNNYMNWNSFYNPYYQSVVVINPKNNPAGYTTMRNFNRSGYSNNRTLNANGARPALRAPIRSNDTRSNSSGTLGNSFRRAFSGSNSDANSGRTRDNYVAPSTQRPVRTYNPSRNNNNNNNNSNYTPSTNIRSNSSGSGSSPSSNSGGAGGRPSRR